MRSIRLLRVMMWSRAAPCEKKKSVEEFLKIPQRTLVFREMGKSGQGLKLCAGIQFMPGKDTVFQSQVAARGALLGQSQRSGIQIGEMPHVAAHGEMDMTTQKVAVLLHGRRVLIIIVVAVGYKKLHAVY